MRKVIYLLLCAVALNNCAVFTIIPPAVQYASTAATIISYMTTSKGTSDHVVSVVMDQDCALHRALTRGKICFQKDLQTAKVMLDANHHSAVWTTTPTFNQLLF